MENNSENKDQYLPAVIEIVKEDEEMIEKLADLERRRLKCNIIISTFAASAGATGAIPFPFADAPLLIGEQVVMLLELSDIFGLNVKKHALRSLLFTILGTSGTTIAGKTITGALFKLIPGIGTAAGSVICGTTAAALTAALGKAYQQLCEAVYIGELDEAEMLTEKGRLMLETAFKNNVRLEMKSKPKEDDVLEQTSVPQDDQPIEMTSSLSGPSDEE